MKKKQIYKIAGSKWYLQALISPATAPEKRLMSTHASILVDTVGPPSAEVCRTVASFP